MDTRTAISTDPPIFATIRRSEVSLKQGFKKETLCGKLKTGAVGESGRREEMERVAGENFEEVREDPKKG